MTLLSMQDSTVTSSKKLLICEHCDSGDPAVSRCTTCCVFMCDFCVTAHRRINAFKGHKILSLEEVKRAGSKALVKPTFCEKHGGELLKLFCQTCQKTICRDCTIVDHREHRYNFVADIAEKERSSVRAILEKTKTKEKAVAEGLKAVQIMKNCVLKQVSEISKQVDSFFDEQVKALEYQRANLKHEVTKQGQVKVKQLDTQAEVLSSLLVQLRSGINFTGQAIVDGDDVELLSMKTQLVQRLSQLSSSQDQLKPCQNDYMKFQVQRSIWDIGKMSYVSYRSYDPERCTVSMVGGEEGVMYQTIANQIVDFVLTIKGEQGNKVAEGGHKVTVQVAFDSTTSEASATNRNTKVSRKKSEEVRVKTVGKDRPKCVEELVVRDKGDGSYNFSYCPRSTGVATLSVMVEGQHVNGSPFEWEANPWPELNVTQNTGFVSVFQRQETVLREGMHCWKLQLLVGDEDTVSPLAIGVQTQVAGYYKGSSMNDESWIWNLNRKGSSRSDRKPASIKDVVDKDVFTVFLNLENNKLIVYNVRSKQAEVFTNVKGNTLFLLFHLKRTT